MSQRETAKEKPPNIVLNSQCSSCYKSIREPDIDQKETISILVY